jgi:diguanylate cyclase (GGDEF)-like protein
VRIAELEHLATTDSHTLAFNRRYFEPRLREEMERARRMATTLSLLLMDLDHFKRVNDRFGHAIGDRVLRNFADGVREKVRTIDIFVRRGGEEFVLLMPATAMDEALRVADRIRIATPTRALYTTVSIGVATWDGREDADSFEQRADGALYQAKREGRNRVVAAAQRERAMVFSYAHSAKPIPSGERSGAAVP